MIVEEQQDVDVLEPAKDLDGLKKQIIEYTAQAKDLEIITAANFRRAGIYTGACRAAENWIDETRLATTKPLRERVQEINDDHNAVKADFEQLRERIEAAADLYLQEQERIKQEEQRLAIEEANRIERERLEKIRVERERLEKEEEAERIARDKADLEEKDVDLKIERAARELREFQESLPENLTVLQQRQLKTREDRVIRLREEKARLETVVIDTTKTDQRREQLAILEAEASVPVVAQVVERVAPKVETGAGSTTFRPATMTWMLPNWPDTTKKFFTRDLVSEQEMNSLPTRIQFLLRNSILDAPSLNKTYGTGAKFPVPFAEVREAGGSTVRGKRK